jgi:hypothetical protein
MNEPQVANQVAEPQDDAWLTMARDAYVQSSDWFDASLRPSIEKALAHFSNRHAPGSKYYSDSYKFRAKGFRPKTRATIRRNEAAAAVAFFSTSDMVSVTAENSNDKSQVVSAAVLSELLNYRLDDSIPWFLTVIGAYQNALNVGVVVSHQTWEFEERTDEYPLIDENGNSILTEAGQPAVREVGRIVSDKPRIDLVAIENLRISPAADWADPMGTTPYVIELIPMFIGDIKEKMADGKWIEYSDGEIQQAGANQYDTIRAARDGKKRQDSMDVTHATADFDTVFVHRNIIRQDGEDWIFYTLGTDLRLSDPVLLRHEYRHLRPKERPYVMGFAVLEAHKPIPPGLNELTATLQEEANDVGNQRRDNVALAMNKRYFAKRTANIDYRSLTRNVPGSVTLVDDINADIRWDAPGDVTGSAYAEQDRVSLDYDELAGTFSPGSVQSNRQLNETVGGMEMLSNDSNVMTEYQLRVFAETWVEPVLKQLVRMEQAYETDEIVLAVAGQRAQLLQKFGIDRVTDAMLQGMVTVNVNVGFGATNPQKRIERLALGMKTVAGFAPGLLQGLDTKEMATEVFGALGYKGAERFFPQLGQQGEDPRIAQMQQMIQKLQQELGNRQLEVEGRKAVETIRQKGETIRTKMELDAEMQDNELDRMLQQSIAQVEAQLEGAKLTAEERTAFQTIKAAIMRDAMKLRTQRELSIGARQVQQVALPAMEPQGRAPAGEAFQR